MNCCGALSVVLAIVRVNRWVLEALRGETHDQLLSSFVVAGDLGWNPLKINVTDRRRLVELQNGRAAMFAISAWVCHDAIPGSVPIPLLWD